MHKRHEMIDSPALGQKVHVWCYGHWGMPMLVFPSAAGMAHEWDANGMIDCLAPFINSGKIKVYCTESNISRSWVNREIHPEERVHRHQAFEHFILSDLVPAIYRDCNAEYLPMYTSGCSLGGYYAANFALKFPHIFRYALCMSGRYNITHFTDGYSNSEIYFNNPLAFVPNLEGEALGHVQRNTKIVLVCGQGPYEEGCIEETRELGAALGAKGIPNYIDIWGHDVAHDWDWWRRQLAHHMSQFLG